MSFQEYYVNQCGRGAALNFYQGRRYQKGHGLGNILGSLFRAALPVLKKTAVGVGKDLLRTTVRQGGKLVKDVARGNSFKQSLKKRTIEGGEHLINKRIKARKTQRRPVRRIRRTRSLKPQTHSDIFD